MRSIGTIEREDLARSFGGYLFSQDIENQVDPDGQGGFEIWVLDDDDLDRASEMFSRFKTNPSDPVYAEGARRAQSKRKEVEKVRTKRRARVIDARTIHYRPPIPYGMLTVTLIAVSVIVTVATKMGANNPVTRAVQISDFRHVGQGVLFPEIRQGQIWRLVTPIFLHFDILHILFNMLWLKDLGSLIEARKGTGRLALLVLTIAVISNVAQYLVSGPMFGGMSGVVFGLLGYVWMQGKFNPSSQLAINPQTVTFMIIWFVVCLTGMVGPVANTAHAGGAIVGIAWGYLAARYLPNW